MNPLCPVLLGAALISISSGWAADITINEIMAAPSERQVRWPSNGVAQVGTGIAWPEAAFDSSQWETGTGPFGYGYEGIRTDLKTTMAGVTPSLYARIHFSVSPDQAALADPLEFLVDYDDGFTAYLNGREFARRNLGASGGFVCHDQPAFNARFGAGPETVVAGAARDWLKSGDNVLCVQAHDRGLAADVRFKFHGTLQIASAGPVVLVEADSVWKYYVGVAEPSGGISDPSVSGPGFCDWIELFNPSAEPVSLEGWSLSDRAGATNRWVFPAVTMAPGDYLVVLASGHDLRDPRVPFLHADFKLDAEGEFLGLYNSAGQLVHQLGAPFPRQVSTHSYGWDPTVAGYRYFENPSPGTENAGGRLVGILGTPLFNLPPGFCSGPVALSMTAPDPGATIFYTTNGAEPTVSNGRLYSGPIELIKSTAVRARAFKEGWIPSDTVTRTFLVDEPEALKSLTAVSLVADPERSLYTPHGVTSIAGGSSLFGPWRAFGPNDYNIPMEEGRPFERPASLEILHPGLGGWLQIPCGLRISGSAHTRSRYLLLGLEENPWDGMWQQKPSFNLFFRNEYGADRLHFPLVPGLDEDSFHDLKLRAGKVDWENPFLIDEWVRRTFVAMGHEGSMGLLVNLFVNGQFKCYYNLVERVREEFLQDRHGSELRWDVIDGNVAEEGDAEAWKSMLSFILTNDLRVLELYNSASQQLDMTNFVDYLIINLYGGNLDWPEQNYVAARERREGARFRFYVWDAEAAMGADPNTYNLFDELKTSPGIPIPDLYQALAVSPEFRLLFADRIQKHFFHDGALTEENLGNRLEQLAEPLDAVMKFVRGGMPVERNRLTNWISVRRPVLFDQFARENLWPSILAPLFNQHGGEVSPGFQAALTNPNPAGALYFTIDGSDPRAPDNTPRGTVYTQPVAVQFLTRIKARVFQNAAWSPLSEATFSVRTSPSLVISEIMYHPPDAGTTNGTRLEFIELRNVGDSVVRLDGFQFIDGITYTFPLGATLGPGEYLVLASDRVAFANHYGGLQPFDQFEGNLENSGERIALADSAGRETLSLTYDDQPPWPTTPDGGGFSLTPSDDSRILDPSNPANWRPSLNPGGSPGRQDPVSTGIRILREQGAVVLTWHEIWTLQSSSDLQSWVDLPSAVSPLTLSAGSNTNQFWRLRRLPR